MKPEAWVLGVKGDLTYLVDEYTNICNKSYKLMPQTQSESCTHSLMQYDSCVALLDNTQSNWNKALQIWCLPALR